MKIVIAPDSFKGSLTSKEICEILADGLKTFFPGAEFVCLPIADGGEGTLEAFNKAWPGRLVYAKATDPWFNEISASYLFYEKRGGGIATAIMESAKVAGYISPNPAHIAASSNPAHTSGTTGLPDPTRTTTYGLGLLIRDAIWRGAERIIVGLGGSCTNDGGCGMAAALGTKFYGVPDGGVTFVPTGGTLAEISHIDNRETIKLLGGDRGFFEGKSVDIVGMCDVTNPLCGQFGAAHVFAPQKGASERDVLLLDEGLRHLVSLIDDSEKASAGSALFPGSIPAATLAELPGSGAAGGLGFGIRAFAGGRLQNGIDLMLDTVNFDKHLWNADLVITGEGRLDSQSFNGKVVSGVCKRTEKENVPTMILCGIADDTAKAALGKMNSNGQTNMTIVETGPVCFEKLSANEIKNQAIENIQKIIPNIAQLINSASGQ